MAIPGEDFLLRLREATTPSLRVNVLDLIAAPVADPVALCDWEAGDAAGLRNAGFALIRFDPLGNVRWQLSRVFCGPGPADACGKWVLQAGAITSMSPGFLIVGTIVRAGTDVPQMIAMGVTDGGGIMWLRSYTGFIGGRSVQGRAIGVVPLAAPGEYLVAANSAEANDSWFFKIDGNGIASGTAFIVPNTTVRRLRALPTQRICAVGEKYIAARTPRAWILNIDPTTIKPVWERVYDSGPQPDQTGVRWFDIAEGETSMVAVGNLVSGIDERIPLFASLGKDTAPPPGPGETRWARQARFAGERIRLRGVASFQNADASAFSFCGDFDAFPWHFAMIEDGAVSWQKAYRIPPDSEGTLAPIVWPAFDQIVVGGHVSSDGVMASSRFAIDSGTTRCASETHAEFPFVEMTSEAQTSPMPTFTVVTAEWFDDQAPPLNADRGCLDQLGG
jgi:hypothetical protein